MDAKHRNPGDSIRGLTVRLACSPAEAQDLVDQRNLGQESLGLITEDHAQYKADHSRNHIEHYVPLYLTRDLSFERSETAWWARPMAA